MRLSCSGVTKPSGTAVLLSFWADRKQQKVGEERQLTRFEPLIVPSGA
jgi:hypothetical protein